MALVVKDQIKIIANNPDIYKKQTLKELTTEVNTALIPLITAVREDLAKSIGVSTSSVMNGDINYVQDCPKTEGAVKTYFATLSFIVNQYKGARFLYADEDLREEYFENPVSTFKPGRTGRSEIDPMCQVTFSSMGKTVTEEEITEAFDQSQTALVNYAIELNTAYQNIVDDFLRQKYSTSYNTKNYKLLNAAGLWETTGEATGLEPNGDWYGEALEEQNNCLDAIIVILKTTPTAAQKVYKEDPKLYEVNSIVNNYLKNIRISDQRDAEFRSYVGIVGMVVGTLLILTFFGSEAGMALIGISEGSVAATTIAATSTAITAVGTPVFVASLGYETANNIKDNNKFEKEENKTVTSVSNGEDADLEYLDYLNESEAEAVSSAMVNGFFTALGVAGGIARVVEYLGFLNKEEAIKWYAELSETINTDPEFAFKCELLNKKLLTGNSSEKFDLLIRYAQEAGLTTSDIKSNAMFYIDSDINFLQKTFSKQGLRLFKDWYAKSVKQINQEAGNKILKIVTTDEESSLWNRELTEFLIKNPEIKEPLSEALGGMTQKDVYSFLEELANMRPDDAAKILKGFKNSSISTKITNFINTIKPSTKYLETLNHKLKSFLSSMVNMEPEIVDEALTPEIIARFPTFHKANNWTNKLATLKKTDGTPINEAVLSRYLRVDSEGELQINSCRMKQTECSEQHSDVNYYTDIGPKLGKILKGSNFDDFAEKWVLAPAIEDGKYTLKWFKVKMVTRNFSKQAYEKELARQNAKGVFKNIKDDFANDPEALKKLKFYWITRVQPTMEQPGVENACVEAWRTIFDCYDIETTSRWARIELSFRKLIWPPEGYPPGHPLYNK